MGDRKQVKLRTLFLRAPFQDWAALTQGFKTEFRTLPQGAPANEFYTPTPVVLFTISPQLKSRSEKLMVLVEHRSERLHEIGDNPGALLREGFETYDHFRRYWRARTRRAYRALDKVEVFRLAPWLPTERERLGPFLLDRLYGNYLS